ncbi:NAD(P)/FAD-dependent oxidoreductase [Pseudooceanicola algae]|uniref:Monomeric sarcosine oxidase n=1 Tax=Pseudooceanicola algae TaxID=1537215 RepID=A0A418SIQ5_9RHOB|nr:FAD-dependent oxidoreductase [Pseudooceanicola algae]QPM91135.1 Monomeric sarcosine oxidase [Pseudooceanicola algae]
MHIAVIGAGMIGAAAARHLALAGHRVTLVGAAEPADRIAHDGPFASHYDSGRITRQMDPSPFWSRASRASIARYRGLEAETGVPFFSEVGSLMTAPGEHPDTARCRAVLTRDALPCSVLDTAEMGARFPAYACPEGFTGFHEPSLAGMIDPREMVRAQIIAARSHGATLIRDVVIGVDETAQATRIALRDGAPFEADRALIATGGFTRALTGAALPLTTMGRTVVLFEVTEAEVARLGPLPTLISLWRGGEDFYLLPPLRYPDGRLYVKLGGDPADMPLEVADMTEWFRSDGDAGVARYLKGLMAQIMPGLNVTATRTLPCVTTYMPSDLPAIGALSDRVFTAVAGCGRGAKNSDELGRLAGLLVSGKALPDWAAGPLGL